MWIKNRKCKMSSFSKRNRSDNFDETDTDLFIKLIEQNKKLIESPKIEDKRTGWNNITDDFNKKCVGPNRDVGALRMKLKNMKAQSKKFRSEEAPKKDKDEEESEAEDQTEDESMNDSKTPRKRAKVFNRADTALLQQLSEKFFTGPIFQNNSYTKQSLEHRNKAWDSVTKEYNRSQTGGKRSIDELKIKYKNLKQQKQIKQEENGQLTTYIVEQTFTDDQDLEEQFTEITEEKAVPQNQNVKILNETIAPPSISSRTYQPLAARKRFNVSDIGDGALDSLDSSDDELEDDYYPKLFRQQPVRKSQEESSQRNLERIRKENLLLKNAVLKKKERLLELQIAIAERNLRRHQC